jgi:hypothetical protein
MDGPERAGPSDELELQVSDTRAGASPGAVPAAGSSIAPRRRLPRRLAPVAAVLALAVVVAATPQLRVPVLAVFLGPPATPTVSLLPRYPTPAPGPRVRWQPSVPLPDQLTLGSGNVGGAIAPSDGRIAYFCAVSPPPQGTPTVTGETSQFWVTHDRGAHWAEARAISAQSNATRCDAEIDALDSSLVVLASSYEDPAVTAPGPVDSLPNQTVSEATFDGGGAWQRLAGNQQLFGLTTVHGVTYAMRATQPGQDPSAPITISLSMSRDQLRTWTPIDAAVREASAQQQEWDYRLNPTTGALLLVTSDNSGQSYRLWSSGDTGQHWRELPMLAGYGDGFPQLWLPQPSGAAPERVCAAPASGPTGTSVACSADGGLTWSHPVEFPYTNQRGFGALAPDGALLFTGSGTDAQGNATRDTVLYRLQPGATRWQALGPAPAPGVVSVAGPGTGMLWALPIDQPGSGAQGQIFTAVYP